MSASNHRHIFIVDDNEVYSMMLNYFLSKDSVYKFVNFKSGEECIRNLYLKPEIIILDYGMPGINGYQTLLEIKKYDPNIHVVILTSHEDEQLKQDLLAGGADDVVLKQGRGENQIIEKIENILNAGDPKTQVVKKRKNLVLYFLIAIALLTLGFFYYK